MRSAPIIAIVCAVLSLVLGATSGCVGKSRQAFLPNFGSALVAVSQATDAVANYHKQYARFPFFAGASAQLEPFGLSAEAASLVQLLDTNTTPVSPATDTICVISIRTTDDRKLRPCRYVGLLSGEVVLLPEERAVLGRPCVGR